MVISNRRILFRCDGGLVPEIGTGHISRTIALAKAFVANGFCHKKNIIFLTQSSLDFRIGRALLERAGFSAVNLLPTHYENNTSTELNSILSFAPDFIVLDRLDTNAMLIDGLKKASKLVITFDDRGEGRNAAHLAINSIFQDVPDSANLLKGYEYLVLPNTNVNMKKTIQPIVKQISISFGGFDNRNLTEFYLETMQNLSENNYQINLIVGELAIERYQSVCELVEKLSRKLQKKIKIFHRPAAFYTLIQQSDLVVIAGGLFVFECLMYGIPSIGLPQYQHQLETLQKLSSLEAVVLGAPDMTLNQDYFQRAFDTLLNSHMARQQLSSKGQALVDGNGLTRIMERIQALCV